MNRQAFFDEIRHSLFSDRITQNQIDGLNFKLTAWEKSGLTDIRWLAYMLATSYHETAKTMQPIEEYGKGRGKPYGQKLRHDRKPYTFPDKLYYGRGDVQLTWYENYEAMGKLLGIPLLEQPELALKPDISAQIMIEGMTRGKSNRGDFTGVSLENYFNAAKDDPVHARRIINGLDKANLIATYHNKFLTAIKKAQ
jgi:putative chitinase